MFGLFVKDMYCLRKSLRFFAAVTLGTIFVAVLFAYSMQEGNLATAIESMRAEGFEDTASEEMMLGMFNGAIYVMLCFPMAFVANIIDCFKADYKADFGKLQFSLPMSPMKMVGSRYLTCVAFAAVSLGGSLIAAALVAGALKSIGFSELASVVLCAASVLVMYTVFVMALLYIFGTRRADLMMATPLLLALCVMPFAMNSVLSGTDDSEAEAVLMSTFGKIETFITEKGWVMMLITLAVLALSFGVAYISVSRRKGAVQ